MKRKRFTEEQIIRALKEYEGGRTTKDICRDLGVSTASFYEHGILLFMAEEVCGHGGFAPTGLVPLRGTPTFRVCGVASFC